MDRGGQGPAGLVVDATMATPLPRGPGARGFAPVGVTGWKSDVERAELTLPFAQWAGKGSPGQNPAES